MNCLKWWHKMKAADVYCKSAALSCFHGLAHTPHDVYNAAFNVHISRRASSLVLRPQKWARVINWRAAQICFEARLQPREPLRSRAAGCHRLNHHLQTRYDLALPSLVFQLLPSYTATERVIISWLYCHLIHQPINQRTTPRQSEVSPPLLRALECCGFRFIADCATASSLKSIVMLI